MADRDAPFYKRVSSRYGAPMGRSNWGEMCHKVRLVRVPFVDGDYDPGGAYWGGGHNTDPLYCAWSEHGVAYIRASTRDVAKKKLSAMFHDISFHR